MTTGPFTVLHGIPFDPAYPLWSVGPVARLWDGDGWKAESLSWKEGCYIHGGLSGPGQIRYHGPDVVEFLQGIFVNNFSRFKVGVAKHVIACNDDGLIAGHGVLQRLAEDDFRIFVHGQWAPFQHVRTSLNVTQEVQNNYLFQVAGPKSAEILNAASGADLGDIAFLRYRNITIDGMECEVMRIGMAGSLAYELHGPIEQGPAIYQAVRAAGAPHNIKQLGYKTYYVNHIEGGFPQQNWTFLSATVADPDFAAFAATARNYRTGSGKPLLCGSVDPADLRARFRTPHELGWERSVVFDHDFIGRAALEAEHAAPKRTVVTLEWNGDDVADVFASLLRDGPDYKTFDFPTTPQHSGMIGHADHVLKDGKRVGIASGVAYSYYFRKMLSHCTIDLDQARIGNDVVVDWGDFGGPIKQIRARVARFPYLSEGRNRTV